MQKFTEFQKLKQRYPENKVANYMKVNHNVYLSEGTIRAIVSRVKKIVANKEPSLN